MGLGEHSCRGEAPGLELLPLRKRALVVEIEHPELVLATAEGELMDLPDPGRVVEGRQGDHPLLPRAELDEHVRPVHPDDGAIDHVQGMGASLRLYLRACRVKAGHGEGRAA